MAPLALVNNAVLFFGTILGAGVTVYGDLFPGSTARQMLAPMAALWLLGAVFTVWLLGYRDGASARQHGLFLGTLKLGWRLLTTNVPYALLMLFMLLASAWCFHGTVMAREDGAGALKTLVAIAGRTEQAALAAQAAAERTERTVDRIETRSDEILDRTARIEQEIARPQTPRERLARRGVAWSAQSFEQALLRGDVELVRDLLEAGWDPLSPRPDGDGNSLGELFGRHEAGPTTVDLLRVLARHVDLTKPVVRLAASRPRNAATLSVHRCNRSMLEALHQAGIDVRILDQPFTHPDGRLDDPIDHLIRFRPGSTLDPSMFYAGGRCTDEDRQAIVRRVAPPVYR